MKKGLIIIISLLAIIFIPSRVNAASTTVINYQDGDQICNAFKTGGRFYVYVRNYYDQKNYLMKPSSNSCGNSALYGENEKKIKSGTTWVAFGRSFYSKQVYIDDTLVKNKGEYGYYSPFFISNQPKKSTSDYMRTLNPGEKISLYINLKDKKLTGASFKDLRLFFTYDASSYNIGTYNSVSYYVYTDKKTYGPYKLDNISFVNKIRVDSTKYELNKVVSKNLVSGIPSSVKINGIKIIPYDNFNVHKGTFKVFDLKIVGYSTSYSTSKKYVSVSGAEKTLRENIVNDMLEEATIKWNFSSSSPALYYYHHYTNTPIKLNSKSPDRYGIPYVNNVNATMNTFISMTTKNKVTSSNKNKVAYYLYNLPTKYVSDTTTLSGKTIKKGQKVGSTIYLFEKKSTEDSVSQTTQRYKDRTNPNLNFIINNSSYYQGLDCSSSTFLAYAREIPHFLSMAFSNLYFSSYQVRFLGGVGFTAKDVENYVRSKNLISKNTEFTADTYKQYYGAYIKYKYSGTEAQKIYNSFALLIPGDIVAKQGHVRMESGYPVVVCNDGTKTQKYTSGFCDKHKGINPDKSYIIITEVGSYAIKSNGAGRHINKSQTGWKYKLNSNLTDLSSIDDLYSPSKKLVSAFHINRFYTFSELYADYSPFRYYEMDKVTSTNKVEVPSAKLVLDKSYDNVSQALYNQLYKYKKLQGTIVTNYIINAIKIEINGKKYYIYPLQTNKFSLYDDLKNETVINSIKKLDYNKKNSIKISVNIGPNIKSVLSANKIDSENYIKVIDTTGLTAVKPVKSTKIVINEQNVTLNVGSKKKLTTTITPSNTTNKEVVWSSSGSKVVTVDQTGTVTALKAGTVTITAKTKDTGKTGTTTVTVKIPVTGIKLNKTSTTLNVGSSEKIVATILPSNATNKGVTWSSANTSIATVSSSGTVKGISAGTTTITATTKDGKKTATLTVKVIKKNIPVTGVKLNKTTTTINVGGSEKVIATVLPSNASNKTVTWSSSNTSIATVSSTGVIKGIKAGTATIKVTTKDGSKTASIKVTIVNPTVKVTGLKLNKTATTIHAGNLEQLKATITPSNATNKTILWTSSDTSVATVDSTGLIRTIKDGTTTITATSADGGKTATVAVTVVKPVVPVTGVKLNTVYKALDAGESIQLVATVSPADATNKKVFWTSSNTKVATVSSNGKVQTKGPGTATITVRTEFGSKTATAKIVVTKEEVEDPIQQEEPPQEEVKVEDDVEQATEPAPIQPPVTPSSNQQVDEPDGSYEDYNNYEPKEEEKVANNNSNNSIIWILGGVVLVAIISTITILFKRSKNKV